MHKFIFITSLFSMARTVETSQISVFIYDTHENSDMQQHIHIQGLVCEVWEMHFHTCKMGIITVRGPHYSFDDIINWRKFIVQFRPPLQLHQKGEDLTVSKLWHGAAEDMRCHRQPLRISGCSTGYDQRRKAKPQELACTASYPREHSSTVKSADTKN